MTILDGGGDILRGGDAAHGMGFAVLVHFRGAVAAASGVATLPDPGVVERAVQRASVACLMHRPGS